MALKLSFSMSKICTKFFHLRSHIPRNPSLLACARNYCDDFVNFDRLPNTSTPWLMLPPEKDKNNNVFDQFWSPWDDYSVSINREECLGVPNSAKCFASTRGWLAFVDTKEDCPIYLTSPYRVKDVIRLPSLSTMPCLRPAAKSDPKKLVKNCAISHLALSSWNVGDSIDESSIAVASVRVGEQCEQRYYQIPKSKNNLDWKMLISQEGKSIEYLDKQVIFSDRKGLFYAISQDEIHGFSLTKYDEIRLRSRIAHKFDDHDALRREFEKRESEAYKQMRKLCKMERYIVPVDNGDILYVLRHYQADEPSDNEKEDDNEAEKEVDEDEDEDEESEEHGLKHKTLMFDVFRVDFYGNKLERVQSLGDRALFVGANQSFSVDTKLYGYPGLEGNSIYFTDHTHLARTYTNSEVGRYDLANGSIEFYLKQDEDPYPLSGRNNIFWIPPQVLIN